MSKHEKVLCIMNAVYYIFVFDEKTPEQLKIVLLSFITETKLMNF